MLNLLLQFGFLAFVIVLAGYKLTLIGDKLADETGFGENIVGFILLAAVTSMPEMSTSITAAKLSQPNLVFGNMIGSNIFNMVIIGLILLYPFKNKQTLKADEKNIFTASLGIFFAAVTGILIYLKLATAGHILVFIYIAMMFLNYRFEKKGNIEEDVKPSFKFKQLYKDYIFFLILSVIVIFSGYYMTGICDKIAVTPFSLFSKTYTLGTTFVGQLFLAVSTSLPELIVSFSAVKIGKINMAYSNVFGSNIFNLAILGVSSFFYKGNMFLNAETFLFSIMLFILLVSTAIASLQYKSKRKLDISALIIISLYILNLFVIFNK